MDIRTLCVCVFCVCVETTFSCVLGCLEKYLGFTCYVPVGCLPAQGTTQDVLDIVKCSMRKKNSMLRTTIQNKNLSIPHTNLVFFGHVYRHWIQSTPQELVSMRCLHSFFLLKISTLKEEDPSDRCCWIILDCWRLLSFFPFSPDVSFSLTLDLAPVFTNPMISGFHNCTSTGFSSSSASLCLL